MSTPCPRVSRNVQRGFTLIEVLIAALVLAVGLLGLSGLQAISQKLNYSAYKRGQAASLAYEIADAIRANSGNASDYIGTRTPSACDIELSRSDAGSVAENDLDEWENRIACLFPGGTGIAQGSIVQSGNELTIKISWDESQARALAPDEEAPATPETGSDEDRRDEFEVKIQL
ncbi:type IV pilus modification protein PilV [Thiocystis violacea]|uniref:type IV pilus modification protein PilV n=1 Tax=Thiocystis violacea TaxID=13725 RepID=UPI00190635CB|nr:type IV pilus modification protein PilV [Thiocystis violacea]MBK1723740.1 type IV pilus modification protein PilV [Thiocystis violacea]